MKTRRPVKMSPADVRARLATLAAEQTASLPTVSVNTRIHWDGDMANDPGNATVTKAEGGHMWLTFDDGRKSVTPVAILTSPRWRVLSA